MSPPASKMHLDHHRFSTSLVVLASLFVGPAAAATPDMSAQNFEIGDKFHLECKNWTSGAWGPGPVCEETGEEMAFMYGVDSFSYCGWFLTDEYYDSFREIIRTEKHWACRVPMSKAKTFFLPVYLPLWGVVESDHFHLDNHINMLFHADAGRIIGGSIYPVRDKFQFAKKGTTLNMHGPVRWFDKHSYHAFNAAHKSASISTRQDCWMIGLGWASAAAILTALGAVVLYSAVLKPQLAKSMLKKD